MSALARYWAKAKREVLALSPKKTPSCVYDDPSLLSMTTIEREILLELSNAFGYGLIQREPPRLVMWEWDKEMHHAVIEWRGVKVRLCFRIEERALSLDDFSRRNLEPLVAAIRSRLEPAQINEYR